jgi:glucokinase
MTSRNATTIGLDVGGTKILGVARAGDGRVLHEVRAGSEYEAESLLDRMASVAHDVAGRCEAPVRALGVGIAGLVTTDGRLRFGPNLPGVEELDVRTAMEGRTGLPTVVDNDANVAGYAEVLEGAARGARHALVVTLGTGIGGALIVDGAIYRGAQGFAGEIGHWTVMRDGPRCACGDRGHWEAIASGHALARLAQEAVAAGELALAPGEVADGHAVARAARAGDVAASAVLETYAGNVAIGLAGLATILDPECIVLSGGIVEMGELLFAPLRVSFAEHVEGERFRRPIPLLRAALGERAGAIGAAALAATL